MEQKLRLFTAVLLTCALTAQSSECRVLQQTPTAAAGATEVPATGRACSVVCQSPLLLANALKTQPASYACVAKIGSSSVPGYQSGAGSTTCIAVSNEQAVTAENYNCLCLTPTQVQGLAKPDASSSCSDSCQSYAGQLGTPVTGGGANICLAASEVGSTNHFGTVSGKTCSYATGTGIAATSSFSCVCAYGVATSSLTAPAAALSQAGTTLQKPTTQLATAG